MGALATLLAERYDGRSLVTTPGDPRVLRPRARARLGALGASYFSAGVAARGWPSAYEELIAAAAAARGVDPNLIRAIISAESAWRPDACSTSSCGLMQINYLAHGLTRTQVLDPSFNVPYGTAVIAEQIARRPTLQLALAGYNAGTGRSDADLDARIAGNVNGVGTYVQTVLEYLTWFQTQSYGTALEAPPAPAAAGAESAEPSAITETASQVLAGVEPWMLWALGGAIALGVVLVVMRRR